MPKSKKSEKNEEDIVVQETEEKKTEIKDKKTKLAALIEKAKELEKSVIEPELKKLGKEGTDSEEEKVETLIPIEDYLKSSIHLGTRVITPDMKKYVYKRRADGLAVFNTALLDKKIRDGSDFLAKYAPENAIIVCKRESGWKIAELFSKITGIRAFTKKYPAGILTNSILEDFIETDLVIICDPWMDKNAFNDAKRIKVPVLAICDTNNYTLGIKQIIPGNNKSAKSLGMILYLLAKTYTEKRKIQIDIPPISEWIENWDALTPPK
ncbi:MAG: 30S ribosomal protein S2 [Nanoarchaeota archaeon]